MPLLLVLPVLLSGCLPLLLGNASVLRPGEFSLSAAGMYRTEDLPPAVSQAGPVAAVAEFRGGLPGDVVDAGFTVHAPWNLDWDLKLQFLREGAWMPAAAVRADLGVLQPSFGGSVLVSKSAGPLTVTLMAGRGRRSERLWRDNGTPYSLDSENLVKDVAAWGVGAEYRLGSDDLFAGAVCWDPSTRSEEPKSGRKFGADEGPTWAFTAGIRIRWRIVKPPPPKVVMTALRGYILEDPGEDSLEVGQPGIYRATVLLDGFTGVTADGRQVQRTELRRGRAVLIQGIALPRPSTFLARSIELQ